MKKTLITAMCLLALSGVIFAANQEKGKEGLAADPKPVIRTYQLKNVDPLEIQDLVSPFVLQRRSDSASKYLVVTLFPENVKALEELLARLDVERPQVNFRVFTLIASQKPGAPALEVPELVEVVENLRRVLGFKSYSLDGVSAITVRSGSRRNELELSSKIPGLTLDLDRVAVDVGQEGRRQIRLGLELRIQPYAEVLGKDQAIVSHRLIETEQTAIVEKGTLVAGVSKLGEAGDALVLVIQATIQ
jgi:hypothetical protein